MLKAHHDFETRSAVDLKKTGVYKYVEHPSTAIWMMSWRIGHKPVERWHPGDEPPLELLDHVENGGTMCSHNSAFERTVWNALCVRQHGWPPLKIQQQDDTMARALAHHLPADLETLGIVLGLKQQKDKEGAALMRKMMKPRSEKDGVYVWWNEPEKVSRLGDYCDIDVLSESEVDDRLPPLSPEERQLWEVDQLINDRGMFIDFESVSRYLAVLAVTKQRANERMAELTDGVVKKTSEVQGIMRFLQGRGLEVDSIAKGEHKDIIAICDMMGDEAAKAVIELRASMSAHDFVKGKFQRMFDMRCADGRIRGMLMYHRAVTGRWGGAAVQPQNLPRVDPDKELPSVMEALELAEML